MDASDFLQPTRRKKIAKAVILCMGTDGGRRFSRSPKCIINLSNSSIVGRRSRAALSRNAQPLGDHERVFHRVLVKLKSHAGRTIAKTAARCER
jgi:hypothetical protein